MPVRLLAPTMPSPLPVPLPVPLRARWTISSGLHHVSGRADVDGREPPRVRATHSARLAACARLAEAQAASLAL